MRGECIERVGRVRFFGIGEVMLDLRCSCFDGATRSASLAVTGGKGEALLVGDMRYAVSETRESKEGWRSRAVLGYLFRAHQSAGGIDITRQARAYFPSGLSEEQRRSLSCLYGALLLHRPSK